MNAKTPAQAIAGAGPRLLVSFVIMALLMPAILFLAAGTLNWPMGWAYAIILTCVTVGSRILLLNKFPDLALERAGQHAEEGVQEWDKRLVPLVSVVGPLLMLVVCGLDKRFSWSPEIGLPLQIVALIALTLVSLFATWAMLVNRFFSATVRIQKDRGHTVVDAGPYAIVRHPAYASSVVVDVAGPLALGSLWALVPGLLMIALLVVRTRLEDAALQKELPGYAAYAQRVRARLIPWLW